MIGKKQPRLKQRLLHLMLVAMVAPGLVISVAGILSMSQQKKSRELNLTQSYWEKLVQIRNETEKEIERIINAAFEGLAGQKMDLQNSSSILEALKETLLKNPIIKYPFIISSEGEFRFPISKKAKHHLPKIPWDRIYKTPSGRKYRAGENAEFKERKFDAAIGLYSQALKIHGSRDIAPYIYISIARCYFKMKKYPQAGAYLADLLNRYPEQLKKDRGLYFSSLYQYARALSGSNNQERAAKIYLTLYDSLLEYQSTDSTDRFAFFKNEALTYLALYFHQSRGKNKKNDSRTPGEEFQNMSEVDIALRWQFYEVDSFIPSIQEMGGMENSNELFFRKIQEFYLSTDEKNLFYNSIKGLPAWKIQEVQDFRIDTISTSPGVMPVNIAFKKIGKLGGAKKQVNYFFGFLVSDQHIESIIFPNMVAQYIKGQDASVQLMEEASSFEPERDGYDPMNTAFRQFLPGKKTVLSFKEKNFIKNSIQRELWINYGLIAALWAALVFGILFFYKYMSREAQMINIKTAFVDSASHTLKTPLTRIRILAEKMELGWIIDEDKKKSYLRTIMAETDRMTEMITNMLDFSKIEADKKEYLKVNGSFNRCLEAVMNRFAPGLADQGFCFEKEITTDIPEFPFDPDAMQMIIANLVQNAIKYSPGEKYLGIRAVLEQDELVFSVTDRGMGIPAGLSDKIFEKFYRVPNSSVKAKEGSGLGLFLVQHAVKAHEGSISIHSPGKKGTVITIRFPINPQISAKGNIENGG